MVLQYRYQVSIIQVSIGYKKLLSTIRILVLQRKTNYIIRLGHFYLKRRNYNEKIQVYFSRAYFENFD